MDKINFKKVAIIMAGFLVIEALSFLVFSHSLLNGAILVILSLAVAALSAYRLEYGFLALVSELFIGSMGHLFFVNLSAGQLPLRIAIWSAFMIVFIIKLVIQLARQGQESSYLKNLKEFGEKKVFLILGIFIIISLINGFIRGHALGLIFSDFNAWLFFLLIIPAVAIYGDAGEEKFSRLKTVFLAGALWMSLKTLIFLYIFTHDSSAAPEIYNWLRRTLNGEMTPTNAGWPRIFIQGQIYSGSAFFLCFWASQANSKIKDIFKRINILPLLAAGLFLSTLIISFSRSFWAGLIIALAFSLVLVWRFYSFKKMLAASVWLISSFILSFVVIYAVAAFPYIYETGNFGASFLDRVSNSNEAAVASRWSLLPALMKEIRKEPILGQGYGATVTYKSSDPRVLQSNPTGIYTTYAFEWGYLELWLKLGLLGLAAYLWLLYQLIKDGVARGLKTKQMLFFGLAAGLIFLAVTNIFTPYLNHPLGIGILVLSSCLIRPNRIY
ncbi:MAG: O-antigen ligase family protein [Patescibacteria group bacterium]|jgi:O-antigen ligase